MSSTLTPNMGLIVPGIGTEPGPTWGTDLNSSLGILDQHNHSAGQGVPITPDGMSITSDLPFNSNNATQLKTVRFTNLSASLAGASPNLGCIYVAGGEIYYNDIVGNVVQITNNGSVNAGAGSITGLPSGTASATYNSGSGTFIWQSATSTAADMDGGSFVFREKVASAKGITVSSPTSLAADYQMFWPTGLPGSTKLLSLSTAGNISFSDVDNSTLQFSGGVLSVKNGGITNTQVSSTAAIDTTKLAQFPLSISGVGGLSTASGTPTNVPNLVATNFQCSGKPLKMYLQGEVTGGGGIVHATTGAAGTGTFYIAVVLDASSFIFFVPFIIDSNSTGMYWPLPQFGVYTGITPGLHTFNVQIYVGSPGAGYSIEIQNARFVVEEM